MFAIISGHLACLIILVVLAYSLGIARRVLMMLRVWLMMMMLVLVVAMMMLWL